MVTGETPSESDVFGLTGKVFEGRFEVLRQVAEGGSAVVYEARHLSLDRRDALKVLKTPREGGEMGQAEFVERFAAEAKTIARLKHPHIVDVYDFAVAELPSGYTAPWMALEWLDGETLATYLRRRREQELGGLAPSAAVDLLRPVLEALAFAHRQGIVHRDVKPANIMVVSGRSPSLQVLDFGIAKLAAAERPAGSGDTRTDGVPTFTPKYAAPEQVTYSRTGAWTDVHALGLILTELLTDEPAYADAEAQLFELVMSTSRPTPGSKGRDVGPFEPIVARALALSPRERWADAGELLAALEATSCVAGAGESTVPMNGPVGPGDGSVMVSAPVARRRPLWPLMIASGLAVVIVGAKLRAGRRSPPPAISVASEPAEVAPSPRESSTSSLDPGPKAVRPYAAGPRAAAIPKASARPSARPKRQAHVAGGPAKRDPATSESTAQPKDLFDGMD